MIHMPKSERIKRMMEAGAEFRSDPEEGFIDKVEIKFRSRAEEAELNLRSPHVYRASGSDYDPYK